RPTFLSSHLLFLFNVTSPTHIYTLSLHDALPISTSSALSCTSTAPSSSRTCSTEVALAIAAVIPGRAIIQASATCDTVTWRDQRSEEHTSELQSLRHLVCRLLLEKKKKKKIQLRK